MKIILTNCYLLFFAFYSWADCPDTKQFWNNFQKIVQNPDNQKELLILQQNGRDCRLQDSTYTLILQKIAENYLLEQDFTHANQNIQEAIKLNSSTQKNIKSVQLIENYELLAKIYDQQGLYLNALESYDRAIAVSMIFKEKVKIIPKFYIQKASIHSRIGDFEKAISQVNIGLIITKQKGNDSLATLCLIERGKAFSLMGELKKAKSDLEKAVELLNHKKDSKLLPYAYYWLAQLANSESDFQEAIEYYQKVQIIYLNTKQYERYAISSESIGIAYYYLKQYDKALENYEKGLKRTVNANQKVIFWDDIAAVYWKKKEYPKAFEGYQKALSIAPINFISQTSFDNPTVKNLKLTDYKSYYLTTLQDKADTWLEYYQTTKQKENLKIALDTYLIADKLIDLMRSEHTGTQSKIYWRNKTHHLYGQAIETCFLLKNYEKAFYFFEKSKAVLLNDQLNELTAKQQLSVADLAQEKDFQQKKAELNKKLSSEAENSKNYENFQRQLVEEQRKEEAFIKRLETTNPTYFKYKYDTTLVTLKNVKQYLAKDQTILEYFMGDDAIYALIISTEKTELQKTPASDYAINANKFLAYCSDKHDINQNFQKFLVISNQIYQQIFRYLNVPKGRLIITQDGYFLPFEALSKSPKRAEYLLNDYAISYTYSVQFLLKNLSKNSFSFSHKFMGMSPVNYAKNLNQTSLLGSDISLSEVASNYVFGKKFSAKEATKNSFLTNAKDYKIVHLYTHAQADSTDQEPMIYFADSVLKLSELDALERFKTQLLVLSACKTAVGKNAKGEGILSLSRGFAALGIPATLTTLWSVENQSTYTLNELFYRYLSEGYPKDICLQKAKIEFLQSQSGEKQLPTFWAAAVLVGDAEAVSFSNSWIYVGILILLITFGFLIALTQKRKVFFKNHVKYF